LKFIRSKIHPTGLQFTISIITFYFREFLSIAKKTSCYRDKTFSPSRKIFFWQIFFSYSKKKILVARKKILRKKKKYFVNIS